MRVAILRARWQIRVGVVLLPLTILGAISLGEERYEKAIGEPLLAHWTFNEGKEAGPVRDTSGNPAFAAPIENGVPRSRGVFGSALHLNGPHALRVVGAIGCDELAGITFSAWARPTDLSGYREIFRQECVNRLLFSFQANGSILALGLNIGGYLECDARIPRDVLLDGILASHSR